MIGGSQGAITEGPLAPVDYPDLPLLIVANVVLIVVSLGILAVRYRRSDT
jgi:hypothetical protein